MIVKELIPGVFVKVKDEETWRLYWRIMCQPSRILAEELKGQNNTLISKQTSE